MAQSLRFDRVLVKTVQMRPESPSAVPMLVEVERHYSVAAVADLLQVSKPWVYDRIKSGELPVVELGDSKAKQRIAASTLQRYLDGRTHPAPS